MSNKIYFLGTGTSIGVPELGCNCPVCTSKDPHDKRFRSSVLVTYEGKRILIDCGPDFHEQMLRVPFAPLDAVLLTHEHYDHTFGIDDLRCFSREKPLNIFAEAWLNDILRVRLPHIFIKRYRGAPQIVLNDIEAGKPFLATEGVEVLPIRIYHGQSAILGFRIGDMAYLTDLSRIDDSELEKIKGVKLLVLDALRIESHPTHFSLSEAMAVAKKVGAPHTCFTHMAHSIGLHQAVQEALPDNMTLAYDGLEVVF